MMRSFIRSVPVVLGLFLASPQQTSDQVVLAPRLISGTEAQREASLNEIRRMPAESRSDAVWAAVRTELQRIDTMLTDRERRKAAGEKIADLPEDEYLPTLLAVAAQSHDPAMIPALTRFTGTGDMVMDALVRFGDRAVPEVAKLALDTSSIDESAGFAALRRILVESRPVVSDASRAIMAQAAKKLLTERTGRHAPIAAAAALSLALKDDALIQRVQILARDVAAVRAMGVTNPEWISWLQQTLNLQLTRAGRGAPGRE